MRMRMMNCGRLEKHGWTRFAKGSRGGAPRGWHPEIPVETLLAFSCAGAMGAAHLLSDPSWAFVHEGEDVDALADAVLDLVVHRSRTGAIPAPEGERKVS